MVPGRGSIWYRHPRGIRTSSLAASASKATTSAATSVTFFGKHNKQHPFLPLKYSCLKNVPAFPLSTSASNSTPIRFFCFSWCNPTNLTMPPGSNPSTVQRSPTLTILSSLREEGEKRCREACPHLAKTLRFLSNVQFAAGLRVSCNQFRTQSTCDFRNHAQGVVGGVEFCAGTIDEKEVVGFNTLLNYSATRTTKLVLIIGKDRCHELLTAYIYRARARRVGPNKSLCSCHRAKLKFASLQFQQRCCFLRLACTTLKCSTLLTTSGTLWTGKGCGGTINQSEKKAESLSWRPLSTLLCRL